MERPRDGRSAAPPERRTLETTRETVLTWLRNLLTYNNLENHPRFSSGGAQRASVVRLGYCSAVETVLFRGHWRHFGRARLQSACDLPILQWYDLAPAKL